jgi:inner membrane protease subunit 1
MGPSMLPTFNMDGDIVAIEHLSKKFKKLTVGDVVVCISPVNPGRAVCKRILGMVNENVKSVYKHFCNCLTDFLIL